MNKISCYEINFQQSCWIRRGWAFYNGLTTGFFDPYAICQAMKFYQTTDSCCDLSSWLCFRRPVSFSCNFHIHTPFAQGSHSYVEAQVWYRFCLGAQHIPYRTNTIHVWHISQRITWWVLQEFAYITGHVVCFMNIRHLDHISTGWWFPIFLCSSLFGKMIQFDLYFSNGLKPPTSQPRMSNKPNFAHW